MHEDPLWQKALPLSVTLPSTVSLRLPEFIADWQLRSVSGLPEESTVVVHALSDTPSSKVRGESSSALFARMFGVLLYFWGFSVLASGIQHWGFQHQDSNRAVQGDWFKTTYCTREDHSRKLMWLRCESKHAWTVSFVVLRVYTTF